LNKIETFLNKARIEVLRKQATGYKPDISCGLTTAMARRSLTPVSCTMKNFKKINLSMPISGLCKTAEVENLN